MSSIQERLQLKRVPLDTWNIREQLCLASAVVRSGDQNWMSVSRALKTVGEPNRPPDWYSQKSCAAQYGALLEHVETPKRKKRCSEGAVETPQESIVKRLTQERIVEIQKTIAEMNQQYDQLKNEITEARNQNTSEDRLREIWASIEAAKRARERESARRAAWLKEREERRARSERTWRPPQPTNAAAPAPPSSPLLTSLLKSSPVVTTPQHLPHPANVVDTLSPSVNAPTLSMLLEKSSQHENKHESKHAAIEHIKSQLVQIEQQLKANSSPPPLPAAAPAPAVDIDDIEIKAEDVYVFRDVDLHLPQVTPIQKAAATSTTPNEKPPDMDKKEENDAPIEMETVETQPEVKEEQISIDPAEQEITVDADTEAVEETVIQESTVEEVPVPAAPEVPAVEPEVPPPVLPEVKFPTTEIKVIQDDMKIKEESRESEVTSEESQPEPEVVPEVEGEPDVDAEPEVEEEIVVHEEEAVDNVEEVCEAPVPETPPPPPVEPPVEAPAEVPMEPPPAPPAELSIEQQVAAIVQQEIEPEVVAPDPTEIPLPPEPHPGEVLESPPEPDVAPPEPEPEPEIKQEIVEEQPEVPNENTEPLKTEDESKKDEDAEDSIPLKQMIREESLRNSQMNERDHTETDDDTPMEVSREEEKDGKKRRDYSRKKKSDSRTCSGSESACEASAPDSPHAPDADRQHRLWKKSVMLVYSRLCAHKYASLFLRPITDEEAPGYSAVVKRPMDLSTIRRNIDNGHIRNTAEFQRDVLLMLSNALMYNSSEHSVFSMAKEMHEEAVCQLGMLLAAQAHAGLEAPPRRKRRRHDDKR